MRFWKRGDSVLELRGYGVGLWKAIWSGWKGFNNKVGFRVRNGRRVRFWKDR